MAATPAAVNVQSSGPDGIAVYKQTWTIDGTPTTVYVQASSLVDSASGIAAPIDANGLHVFPSLGTPNASGILSSVGLAPSAIVTLASTVPVTTGKTGTLQHGVFASTDLTMWTLQTVDNAGVATSITNFLTGPGVTYDFKPGSPDEVSTVLASASSCKFQVIAQNLGTNASAGDSVYASFFWAEN